MNQDVFNPKEYNCLIIDLTHGGVKISSELSKLSFNEVFAYDIYNTLNEDNKNLLDTYNVNLIENLNQLSEIDNLLIISPIHCPLQEEDIVKEINGSPTNNYIFLNHHEIIKYILKDYKKEASKFNIPIIEITGVKGKTTNTFILKEIFNNSLVLSSLGAYLFKDNKSITLKKNISITPASIVETIDLARKIANPKCSVFPNCDYLKENIEKYDFNYESVILESSLGVSGIGDIGLLTNILENYPIAKGKLDAKTAKEQIFNCEYVVINSETYSKYYSNINHPNINTFSINDDDANLKVSNIKYDLYQSQIKVDYSNIKTIEGSKISGSFNCTSFAPTKVQLSNILSSITVCLTSGISEGAIIKGLKNFKGVNGRSSIKKVDNSIIIEEINPGLNTTSIKQSIDSANPEKYIVILGGDYGITCEEIDEDKLKEIIEYEIKKRNIKIILTSPLGKSLQDKIDLDIEFIENYKDAINREVKNNKNILFIYRSNYSQLEKR